MVQKITSLGGYIHEYQKSVENPKTFWEHQAEDFYWRKKWDNILDWNFEEPSINWFINGKLNITENIFERNMFLRRNQPAIIWEPNNPDEEGITLTYEELFKKVNKFANALIKMGIEKGDRVIIYMPMIPELAITMLACARIGAIHSIVFAGFSAKSLEERINDTKARLVITSDEAYRGNKIIPIKNIIDDALRDCPSVEYVVVVKRTGGKINMKAGRDLWYHDAIKGLSEENEPEEMDAEDTLFILYTSGSTRKPKGIVHSTGGYMVYTAYTFKNVFKYSDNDVYFCTADIGWITGHSYIIYGPLLCGARTLMFEGIPTYPDAGRLWEIVDKYKVNQLYTAPTAIRSLMTYGKTFLKDKDLSSLKVLGTVGEPINEEAWHWYHDHIGKGNCPIVDTWWQT
ncbi:MAG: AMP-binding protein, partial [Bacteroidales bacterium]|nr:AMP-binding protein [Bacteroidales bacterium]